MKKLGLIIAAVAMVLGFSQCRKPNAPGYNSTVGERVMQDVTLTASRGDNGSSKVSYNGEGLVGDKWVLKFKWDDGDKIVAYDSEGFCGTLQLTGPSGSDNGEFTGSLGITVGSDVTFYYFGKNFTDNGDNSYSVDFGMQNGRMTSDPEDGLDITGKLVLVGTSSYQSSGVYDVTMGVPFSVVKIKFSGFGSGNINVNGMGGTGFTVDNTGDLAYNDNTAATFNTPGTDDFYAVFMPKSTEYRFGNTTGYAAHTWALSANTYYTKSGSSTGEAVSVVGTTPAPTFSVSNDDGVTVTHVEFAPGNLWYGEEGGSKEKTWNFETNQWDYTVGAHLDDPIYEGSYAYYWDPSHICHFYWSKSVSVAVAEAYKDEEEYTPSDKLFTEDPNFEVEGEKYWRTLSFREWCYLLGFDTDPETWEDPEHETDICRDNARNLCGFRLLTDVNVFGLVILPDNTENPSTVLACINTSADLALANAVFLPGVGARGPDGGGTEGRGDEIEIGYNEANWSYYCACDQANVYKDYGYEEYYPIWMMFVTEPEYSIFAPLWEYRDLHATPIRMVRDVE